MKIFQKIIFILNTCMCVLIYVYMRERDREREREKKIVLGFMITIKF